KKTGLAHHALRLHFASIAHQHARPDRATVALHTFQANFYPTGVARRIIAQQRRRLVAVHDEHIEIAVVVEIAKRATAASVMLKDRRANFRTHLNKRSIALIAKNNARAARRIFRGVEMFELGENGARHQQDVGVAIVVQIHHPNAPADEAAFGSQASRGSHIFKLALAIVVVKASRLVLKMSLGNIEMAIEIVIAYAYAHAGQHMAIAAERHTAEQGFLAESAVMVVQQ